MCVLSTVKIYSVTVRLVEAESRTAFAGGGGVGTGGRRGDVALRVGSVIYAGGIVLGLYVQLGDCS